MNIRKYLKNRCVICGAKRLFPFICDDVRCWEADNWARQEFKQYEHIDDAAMRYRARMKLLEAARANRGGEEE